MVRHTQLHQNQLKPNNLNNILAESLQLVCQNLWGEQNYSIAVKTNYDESIGEIDLSYTDISQAFINMIDNSYYSLKTKLEKQESSNQDFTPTLSLQTRNLGEKVEIPIYDNGIGIKSEIQDKIFDPFLSTKSPGEGIGLGWALAHEIIVKQHHGSIKVETKPGEYTEFIIEIPALNSTKTNWRR